MEEPGYGSASTQDMNLMCTNSMSGHMYCSCVRELGTTQPHAAHSVPKQDTEMRNKADRHLRCFLLSVILMQTQTC